MKLLSSLTLLLTTTSLIHVSAQRNRVHGGTVDLVTCNKQESNFHIQLVYMGTGTPNPRYTEAFELAALRWSKVIVGDLPDLEANLVDDWFGGNFERKYNGAVDDVVIGYDIPTTLDGPGGQLGGAGPVFVRRDFVGRPLQTISGVMVFDGLDLDRMPTTDVKLIILHEMAHVLGLVGTTNQRCTFACNAENPFTATEYACKGASREYSKIAPGDLLLENSGGMGTACGHWEENSFRTLASSEVMTGFFEANLFQPISSVTVAALQDIGYEVDFCGADIWPANEDTIKRFEVYKAEQAMAMDAMMEPISPQFGMDVDTGDFVDWNSMDTTMPLDDNGNADSSDASSISSSRLCGGRKSLAQVLGICVVMMTYL